MTELSLTARLSLTTMSTARQTLPCRLCPPRSQTCSQSAPLHCPLPSGWASSSSLNCMLSLTVPPRVSVQLLPVLSRDTVHYQCPLVVQSPLANLSAVAPSG